jgi:hypothetical protein
MRHREGRGEGESGGKESSRGETRLFLFLLVTMTTREQTQRTIGWRMGAYFILDQNPPLW